MLSAPAEVLAERLQSRTGHYMPSSLLHSQLATYEPAEDDESVDTVDVSGTPDEVVADVLDRLGVA